LKKPRFTPSDRILQTAVVKHVWQEIRNEGVYAEHAWLKSKNPNYSQAEGRRGMFTRFHEGRAQRSPSKG
jgi:hypothetical protein